MAELPAAGARRSSIFDVASFRRPTITGSSVLSFSDPQYEELYEMKAKDAVQYENTYRMEPAVKFRSEAVRAIIREVLHNNLEVMYSQQNDDASQEPQLTVRSRHYEPIVCSGLCKTLSNEIRARVRDLDFPRYKLVCLVTIGEKKEQGMRMGSRCVWDHKRDNLASAAYESPNLYAVGTVYAVYYE